VHCIRAETFNRAKLVSSHIRYGIDRYLRRLEGRRRRLALGIVAHQASATDTLEYSHRAIAAHGGLKFVFTPQHGFYGTEQANMIESRNSTDHATGVPLISLYATSRRIHPKYLHSIDCLLFDLQDVGARYYTYLWTLYYCMEACSQSGTPLVVLDRPNIINGVTVEGARLLPEFFSFVGLYDVPQRYGLTIGEFALMLRERVFPWMTLEVVPMVGWDRRMYLDAYANPWIPASPNIPTVETAVVYPGMCLLEGTNLSEGRGTTRPFEIFGAPFLDPDRLVRELRAARMPGVAFRPVRFKPTFDKFAGKVCGGAFVHVTDRNTFLPFRTALQLIATVKRLVPDRFRWYGGAYEYTRDTPAIDLLYGSGEFRKAIDAGKSLRPLFSECEHHAHEFATQARSWWLY
jgi:uncharacterized protein YbbC (DUF1343 family)